jgi:MoaA/NifB/PqqE/SkfB family radical SAM enzyme
MAMVCPTVVTETPEAFNEFRPADIDTVVQQLQRLDTEGKLAYSNQVLLEYLRERGRRVPRQRDECTAGRHQVIINADGEVYPCITESYRRGLRFGNVKEEGFSSIIPRVEAFTCQREEESACWDHYLWTRIVQRHAAERDGAHVVP